MKVVFHTFVLNPTQNSIIIKALHLYKMTAKLNNIVIQSNGRKLDSNNYY